MKSSDILYNRGDMINVIFSAVLLTKIKSSDIPYNLGDMINVIFSAVPLTL